MVTALARAMEHVNKVALVSSALLIAATSLVAQSGASSGTQQQTQSASSSQHHSGHHIQVPIDDVTQPPELVEAESDIDKHNFAAAEALLIKFTAKNETNYAAWFDLGFVENALGKVDDSIAAYRKSVAAKPDVFESNLNLGLQLAKTGSPEAKRFLLAATHLTPTSHPEQGLYRAWLSLGQIVGKSNSDEAVADYQRAALLEPKEAEPHLDAGQLLEQADNFASAEGEYKRALDLAPNSSDAVTGLANAYMHEHKFDLAEQCLRKLVASQPDSASLHIQFARVLAAEGKTAEAIPEMEAGIKLAPADEAALRELADLYVSAKQNDKAESARRQLLQMHPNDPTLHRELGQDLLREKKFADAEKEFETTITLKPDFGEAYGDLAFAAGENKEFPLVIRALDLRLKFLPENPFTYFMRASAYDHLKDFKDAAANYKLFLKDAGGKYPDQEWQAQHRLIAIEPKK